MSSNPLNPWSDSGSRSTWNEKDEILSNVHSRTFTSDKYLRGSTLGQGAWSVVYKVKRVSDGRLFAAKSASDDKQLYNEMKMITEFSHNNFLQFIELHQQGDAVGAKILITELCEGGDLSTYIWHAPGGMDMVEIVLVISQMSDVLAFLHGMNYYHSDVKPKNIFIRRFNPIEVVLGDCADCRTGTHKYWSPDMAAHIPHDGRADDMWALGISVLSMMVQLPHMKRRNRNTVKKDVCNFVDECGYHAQYLEGLNPENRLVKLACQMLVFDPEFRITAADCNQQAMELLEHLDKEGDESKGKGTEGLGIQSPPDFKPASF
ncbi:uncharacterized protein TRIVIDRAFT_39175 [Trichoderma virens Gv29-8]|uniref:Protein kinase domain-containing protein n=1 Tax=Hypocrea virens (strain Gv29-8 / FGSC 10586) TaxID=413071 RepID=G9NB22_HYPVG|nr:uncharacterized protein TRIVIDRAFT_39175 [Trichoderma virens Gv29-8]EHK16032.1 hypothetical protein TRIVIDRAFT_39175 [Trichoderma virens Gv29-8]